MPRNPASFKASLPLLIDRSRARKVPRGKARVTIRIASTILVALIAAGPGAASAQAPKTQWDGVYSDQQSRRGAALYAEHCVSCHGEDLSGGGVESAPALSGTKFLTRWEEQTLGDFFERTVRSMPQDAPGSLTRDQHADILAFILARNDFPAGTTDLSSRADVLTAIKIAARK
jgi:mono/diheme cytochrome c family protein